MKLDFLWRVTIISNLPETLCISVIKGLYGGLYVQATSYDVYKQCMLSFL